MSKRYARFLTAVFCLFLGGLMVWQMLLPDRERSDVENRTLQQRPALTLSSVLDGSYMEDVEAYVQDQFPLRDQWTGLKARTEQLIGKRLFNNIYLCEGETLISKVDAPADGLEKANLNYVSQLAEKSDIPMYLGLIPSAAEVWRDKLPEGAESWDQNAYLSQAAGLGLPMIDFSAALTAHADEPIFYRTDHHWTTYGAYYGYREYLKSVGKTPKSIDDFKFNEAEDFFGTQYSKAKSYNRKADVLSYIDCDAQITINDETDSIYDYSCLDTRDKYKMFLRGNYGFSSVKGSGKGKLLVVKDSYANCLIPYLTGDYEQIDIYDLRYITEGLDKRIEEEDYDEILFLYNCESLLTDSNLPKINLFN